MPYVIYGLEAGMITVGNADAGPSQPAESDECPSEKAAPDDIWLIVQIKSKWWVGLLLVVLCFAGAGLVWLHWRAQKWTIRGVELGGPDQFRHLDQVRKGQLLDEAADWLRPYLGMLLLAAGALLGWVISAGWLARRMMCAAGWTLVALILVHIAEDQFLAATVHAAPTGHHLNAYAMWLQGTSFLGEALLPTAGLVALLGGITAFVRLVTRFALWCRNRRRSQKSKESDGGDSLNIVSLTEDGDRANWCHNASLPATRINGIEEGNQRRMGICLSGGGVRSASFALGALQALQEQDALTPIPEHEHERHSELMRAKYLTAVSGGSYTAGAFLLAVLGKKDNASGQGKPPEGKEAWLDFDHVFRRGSHEFDRLRRHSSYIADGLKEWITAIFIVLRGAFVSTVVLGLVALVAGRWVGYLYNQIGRKGDLGSPWHPMWGPVFATAGVIALALLFWAASTAVILPPKSREILMEIAKMAGVAAGVLVVLGAVIPITTWASMHIIRLSGGTGTTVGGFAVGAVKGGALGLIGVITTIIGLLTRQRTRLLKTVSSAAKTWHEKLGDIGGRVVQWLCVYTGLTIVAAVYLIIFGYSTYVNALVNNPNEHPVISWGIPPWTLPISNYKLTLVLTGLLILFYLLVDETALGLHPFYRSRLASAFAVRRVRSRPGPAGGPSQPEPGCEFTAEPYLLGEVTYLEKYGNPQQKDGKKDGKPPFPHVIFCASAHCSDSEHTPPGRHVLPFTFSYDAVGGPEIGWCKPEQLRKRGSSRLDADLTVEAAMAVSGAAFASATGSYQSAANVILALANARLGTWVVNPQQVINARKDPIREKQWWPARPPIIRRLSYLLREIFGWYPRDLPLVFVTDGGLYENLGLLELFRHRCTEIYCFDASSDAETFAASLGQSVTLAANELGVIVVPEHPELSDPRVGGKDIEAGDLQGRLAMTPVIRASVTYPPRKPDGPPEHGVLIIGRATMDAGTPWEIRRHAASHPLFPNDATGDQWFDDRKFNAYTALGRHVGLHAITAMRAAVG